MLKIEVTRCENPECGAVLDPERAARGAKTCDPRCRAAAFRARHGYRRVSDGGPVPVAPTGRSHASRSKPSGAQVSYFKTVNVLAAELARLRRYGLGQLDGETDHEWARRVLGDALPEKQRERLRGRR